MSQVVGEEKLPQSQELLEANVESLSDLMSRDPEGFQSQDLMRIISAQREQRARWKASEQADAAGGKGKKEKTRADQATILKKASGKVEDLDL